MKDSTKGNPEVLSDVNDSNGSIDACKKCSGLVCCGIVKEGGKIEPPFLTEYDIRQIEYYTGLQMDVFVSEVTNPVTGRSIWKMKTVSRGGCVFFDWKDGKCQIHLYRPMDCRLFPLDIEFSSGKYYWALFKYKRCKIESKDLELLLKYRKKALSILGDQLHDYATVPVPGMNNIGYKILMEL